MKSFLLLCLSFVTLVSGLSSNVYLARAFALNRGAAPKSDSRVSMQSSPRTQASLPAVRVSAPSLTSTLFMPAMMVPDCGDISGRVLLNGLPISGTTISINANSPILRTREQVITATTDAVGYYSATCVPAPRSDQINTALAFGDTSLGQVDRFETYGFIITRGTRIILPTLHLGTLQMVAPVTDSVTLPYTFVWTSTYTNATSYDLTFFWAPGGTVYSTPPDTFTATIASISPEQEGYTTWLRALTPDGIGFSLNRSINVLRP